MTFSCQAALSPLLKGDATICVVGLGYVGLPIALEFSKKFRVIGFDTDAGRIESLLRGVDDNNECNVPSTGRSGIIFTSDEAELSACSVFIVTVPTPVDSEKEPDLNPLRNASKSVAKHLSHGDVVIYESTVFPGCTEEVCVPILEQISGLEYNSEFFAGYSPERIVPGDKKRTLTNTVKITSGSTPEVRKFVAALYERIICAGIHDAPSIKVAEAAKVLENIQRDTNIALVNEVAVILSSLGIDTADVLDAASTKWNFLSFKPGLVGGHCIGVDPYYLIHRAKAQGIDAPLISTSRRVNERMPEHAAAKLKNAMVEKGIELWQSKVLVLGVTFKEDCSDIRNSKVFDLIDEIQKYSGTVEIYDPLVTQDALPRHVKNLSVRSPQFGAYDAIVVAVSHAEFKKITPEKLRGFGKEAVVIFDIKNIYEQTDVDIRL